jgi:hypothetical protein
MTHQHSDTWLNRQQFTVSVKQDRYQLWHTYVPIKVSSLNLTAGVVLLIRRSSPIIMKWPLDARRQSKHCVSLMPQYLQSSSINHSNLFQTPTLLRAPRLTVLTAMSSIIIRLWPSSDAYRAEKRVINSLWICKTTRETFKNRSKST